MFLGGVPRGASGVLYFVPVDVGLGGLPLGGLLWPGLVHLGVSGIPKICDLVLCC